MNVGDTVRAVQLLDMDEKYTDLKKGDVGTVVNVDESVCEVCFCRDIEHDDNSYNWNDDNNSYNMYKWQLEVIKESEPDELEQYKKIGTLEECRTAMEKQKERKPNDIKTSAIGLMYGYCPMCNEQINTMTSENYCTNCGQKLDWGE